MGKILYLIVILFFVGCGDSEDRVSNDSKNSSADTTVRLNVGETKTFALNLDANKIYSVNVKSVKNDKKVNYRVDYLDRLYPEIAVTGINKGEEVFEVVAQTTSGKIENATIKAIVSMQSDKNTSIDEAVNSGNNAGTTTNPTGGGTGGSNGSEGNSNTPPMISPINDPDACNDSDPTWSNVGDSWGTPGGIFSKDLLVWVRSLIPLEPSHIDIYYPRQAKTNKESYIILGEFTYKLPNGRLLDFEMQIRQELAGKFPYFYVKYGEDCFRGNIPSSPISPPDKTLTPVIAGNVF